MSDELVTLLEIAVVVGLLLIVYWARRAGMFGEKSRPRALEDIQTAFPLLIGFGLAAVGLWTFRLALLFGVLGGVGTLFLRARRRKKRATESERRSSQRSRHVL